METVLWLRLRRRIVQLLERDRDRCRRHRIRGGVGLIRAGDHDVMCCAPPSDQDANVYDEPPPVWFRASTLCLKPTSVSAVNGAVLAMPSKYSVSPVGTVLNVRSTFRGYIVTKLVDFSPFESVTVRLMRYRVLPSKS